ncbi:MAG: copper resistance protein CopC, partial [Staphylococcus epidermidis]|nr:copper resistance protein CopC [Staphylococcus epidermidis]
WIMAMSVLVSLVVYMMTLTSDILEDILSFKLEVIMQFPYILSSISLIILFILFILKDMEKIWYWLISIIMIAVISMSRHVWSQQVPLWSIIIRTIHLIGLTLWLGSLVYLICYAIKVKIDQLTSVRRMLLKVNIIAVIMLVFTGILMAIDETNILTLRNNVSAWSIYLVIKIAGTITMMLLGFYQTMHALRQRQQVHRFALMTELLIGMILIFAGIMMSQINIPS